MLSQSNTFYFWVLHKFPSFFFFGNFWIIVIVSHRDGSTERRGIETPRLRGPTSSLSSQEKIQLLLDFSYYKPIYHYWSFSAPSKERSSVMCYFFYVPCPFRAWTIMALHDLLSLLALITFGLFVIDCMNEEVMRWSARGRWMRLIPCDITFTTP